MKKVIIMFALLVAIPISSFPQTIENIDFISPFNEGVAAIKKNNQWAFINKKGDIVIDFRNDLVATKSEEDSYPIFNNGRCLIEKQNNGISYFGYIDPSGNTAIEPQFLNATVFNNNVATVLKLEKEEVGKNTALNKGVVYYKYFEVVIDVNGTIKTYLTQKGVNIALDKKFLRKPPKFLTKQLSNNLIAVKNDKGKWTIKKVMD